MIIDTSALVAILRGEADAERFISALVQPNVPKRLSAASYVELGIVVDRTGDAVIRSKLDELIESVGILLEPVTAQQAMMARSAYRRFGKGSGHPAGLNFGDCFAYALAKFRDEPLLFKGNDFSHTDLSPQS